MLLMNNVKGWNLCLNQGIDTTFCRKIWSEI